MSTRIEPDVLDAVRADIRGDRGDGVLQSNLLIHPPGAAATAPPILSFQRKREIDIPWNELGGYGTPAKAIRACFEDSWGFAKGITAENWADARIARFVRLLPNKALPPNTVPPKVGDFESYAAVHAVTDNRQQPAAFHDGVVMQYGVTRPGIPDRLYLLETEGQAPLTNANFGSFAEYDAAWNRVVGLRQVYQSRDDATKYFTEFEEVDLRPALIVRRYRELSLLLKCAREVRDKTTTLSEGLIKSYVETKTHAEDIEPLRERILRLDLNEYDVQRQVDRLVSDAADLGLLLSDREQKVTTRNAAGQQIEVQLNEGNLYMPQRRTAYWSEYVPVSFWQWLGGRRGSWAPKEEVVTDYTPVDVSKDRLNEMRARHRAAGLNVFTFDQTPSGFVSADGVPLRQIMDRCRDDESFRRTCVVVLPVLEDSLTGQRVLTKYSVFIRPLPGLVPTMLPRISMAESLTYRVAWQGTELGELVNTINLAPGEERTVTITKVFEQETTTTRTTTSIFDINRSETTDLATEMENQTRQEREHASRFDFKSSASGSYMGFTAEASASGGTSSSLKDVSQAISKIARKASQAVSQQNRQEVSTDVSSRTRVANTNVTVATIRNVNQGRSLNLMFHRLTNRYTAGLFLENLRFDVISGVEMIAGSGVYESRSWGLRQLPQVIEVFKAAGLGWTDEAREAYADRLLHGIQDVLDNEYWTPAKASPAGLLEATAEGIPLTSVGKLSYPRMTFGAGQDEEKQPPPDLARRLVSVTIHSDEPMVPEELLVAAPGFYLDAVVGEVPSTEPYSERMREQEIRMRQAEVFVKASEGFYNQARAAQLQAIPGTNTLTAALPNPKQNRLTLAVWNPLPYGEWSLLVDDVEKGTVETIDTSRHIIEFTWDERQPWLEETNAPLPRMSLLNKNSGETIVDRLGVAAIRIADPRRMEPANK